MANDFGVTLEEAVDDLAERVSSAADFMVSEFSQSWETAERYYAGECDLTIEEGRSSLVKTEVRDVIRALLPSVMRVLMHSRTPVAYVPYSIRQAAFVEQQALWVTQEFYKNNGYMQLYSAVLESLRHKAGPVKVYWEENPHPEAFTVTGITQVQALQYNEHPHIVVTEIKEHVPQKDSPIQGTGLYDLKGVRYYENGRIRIEAFPIYEFFCERNASSIDEMIHGHRRMMTVKDAIALGLDYDDWEELDVEDPEQAKAPEASRARRGYMKEGVDIGTPDILNKNVLITEAYAYYDMDADGVPEKYCFWLGGTTYKLLDYERVEDFCIDVVAHDPVPFTVIGRSITDISKSSQDTMTSLLRAIIDNGHIANNPRVAGDPVRTDFNDVMNNAIGAPIKTKGKPELQVFDIPFTAGGLLPVLEYLESDSEQRVGVTKAATGLDPDAMQSTDKNAVMNTIQLAQGQVELMVRNIIETGLIPMFRKILRLSMRHMRPNQLLMYKGAVIPVDIQNFDPDLMAEPQVGLGTASPQQKLQTLSFVYTEQQKYMQQFGLDNPFVSLSQMYNTIEDIVELGGLTNVGRYFNLVDPQAEKVIAERLAEEARLAAEQQAANAPMDPSKAMIEIEGMKAEVEQYKIISHMREVTLKLQADTLTEAERIDLERDRMAMERVLEFLKLRREDLSARVKGEQDATKAKPAAAAKAQQPANAGSVPAIAAE